MRVYVLSRRGHFDFAHPDREEVSTHIAVFDGEAKLWFVNITTEDIIATTDPLELAREIRQYLSRFIISDRADCIRAAEFLEDNADALIDGNLEYEVQQLFEKKAQVDDQILKIRREQERRKVEHELH